MGAGLLPAKIIPIPEPLEAVYALDGTGDTSQKQRMFLGISTQAHPSLADFEQVLSLWMAVPTKPTLGANTA